MINYDSILSAFDGKPTLLQWLKLVKKALDESVLKDITLNQDGTSVIFTFNFEDGTSLSTPAVTLPKGDTGAKGAKGDKGEQGVSVTGVDEVSNEVVGSQTHTTLRFNFSNDTNNEVIVHAENGKKLYQHKMHVWTPLDNAYNLIAISSDNTALINMPGGGPDAHFPFEEFDKILNKIVNYGYFVGETPNGDLNTSLVSVYKDGETYKMKYIVENTIKTYTFPTLYISDSVTEL